MAIHFKKLSIYLFIWNILSNAAAVYAFTDKDKDTDAIITRECKVMTECTFYTDLIKLQKSRLLNLPQEMINDELKKQNCGWENDMDPKGKM